MLGKNFYHSLVLQMTFIHFTTGWTQVDLSDFEKKNMKACETVKHNAELFLSSKLLPRKQRWNKIRRKIFFKTSETFQCYNWSVYYKIPEFRVGAKLSKYWSDVIHDLVLIGSSLAQHLILMQHARIYRALLRSHSKALPYFGKISEGNQVR